MYRKERGMRKAVKLAMNNEHWVIVQVILLFSYILLALTEAQWMEEGVLRSVLVGIFFFGLAMCLVGTGSLKRNLTAFPRPVDNGYLIQKGVYRFVRHPMYGGIMLCAPSYAMLAGNSLMLMLSGVVVVFFVLKTKKEEVYLQERYEQYCEYMHYSKKFLPFIY